MKKLFLFILVIPIILWSQPLSSLYDKVDSSPLYKSKSEAIDAQISIKKAQLFQNGWRAGTEVGFADVKDGSDSGFEYGVSIGKEFVLNGSSIEKIMLINSQYAGMLKTIERNRIAVRLRDLYGKYCIALEAQTAKSELGIIYEDIIRYIDKGVKFGEFDIGKSIMAHLALESLNLQIAELDNELSNYETQIRSIVPFDGEFQCGSMGLDFQKLFDSKNSALYSMLQKKSQEAKNSYKLSKSKIPSLGLDASFNDEIDTRRYMLSLSIPLAYGKGNEAARTAAMHTLAAANNELKAFQKEYFQESKSLRDRLENYRKNLKTIEISIRVSADTLIEQSRMRFKAGEESLISMLKSAETKLQMVEAIIDLKTKRHQIVTEYLYKYAIDPKGVTK